MGRPPGFGLDLPGQGHKGGDLLVFGDTPIALRLEAIALRVSLSTNGTLPSLLAHIISPAQATRGSAPVVLKPLRH